MKKGYAIRVDQDSSVCADNLSARIGDLQVTLISEVTLPIDCSLPEDTSTGADITAPTICLEGDQTIVLEEGDAFIDPGAVAIDGIDGFVSVTSVNNIDEWVPGTYTITYSGVDAAGNVVNAIRNVEVLDVSAPIILMKGDKMVSVVEGETYTDLGASSMDNVDGEVTVTVTNNVNPNVVGWYSVDYTSTDVAGNSSTVSRAVTVTWASGIGNAEGVLLQIDNSDPAFSGEGHPYLSQENAEMVNGNTAAMFFWDIFGVGSDSYFEYDLSGLPDEPGTYEITMNTSTDVDHCYYYSYQILDPNLNVVENFWVDHSSAALSHNQSLFVGQTVLQKGYKVRIDTRSSHCSGNFYKAWADQLEVRGINATEVVVDERFNGVLKIDDTDQVDFTKQYVHLTPGAVNGTTSLILSGTYRKEYVLDQLPEQGHYYDIHMNTMIYDDGCHGAMYSVRDGNGKVLFDANRSHKSYEGTQYTQINVGQTFLKKGYTVLVSTGTCTGYDPLPTIMVDELELVQKAPDRVAPIITLAGSDTIALEEGVAYAELGATVTDDRDSSVALTITENINLSVPGVYSVTYSSIDLSGNVGTATRTVIVPEDTTPPVITINGESTVDIDEWLTYVDQGATASDGILGAVDVITTGTVDTMVQGAYTITYTATDGAGNTTVVDRTVNVTPDATAPVISLTGSDAVSVLIGASYTDADATVLDAHDGVVSISSSDNVDTSVQGMYFVDYTSTDIAGNTATLSRRVIVTDGSQTGNTLLIDNSDEAFSSFGHSQINYYGLVGGAVNGSQLLINTAVPLYSTLDSYADYALNGLPAESGIYQITMNAYGLYSYCDAVSYQVLDANQVVLDSFLVDHSSDVWEYQTFTVGYAVLEQGYSIRIDSASSQCSAGTLLATADQLELVAF